MSKIIGNTTATPVPRSDWAQTDETKIDFILNKPVIGPSDWKQADETKNDYIKNKPELGLLATQDEVSRDFLSTDVRTSLDKADTAENIYETKEIVQAKLDAHANTTTNPHKVTAAQVGAPTVEAMNEAISQKTQVQFITWEAND